MSRRPCRLQGVGDEVRGDLSAHLVSNDQRVAEVDAPPDADLPLVLGELRNARELPGQAWVHEIADGEGHRACAEYGLEDAGAHAAHDAGRRGMLRMTLC